MTLAVFPDSPRPIQPYDWHLDFSTIISKNPESGRIQSRAARSVPLLAASLTYPIRPIADYSALRSFCRWAMGMQTRFTFADFNGTSATLSDPPLAPWPVDSTLGYDGAGAVFVGVGDGIIGTGTLTFDLPFAFTTGAVVYDNGSTTSHYTISPGTGENSRDQVVFDSGYAPTAGHVLTASCTLGRLLIIARLATDSFAAKTTVGGGAPIQPVLTIQQDL